MTWVSTIVVLSVLLFHWVADFILQTDEQAVNKSHDNDALAEHVLTYSVAMTIAVSSLCALVGLHPTIVQIGSFLGTTFVSHFCTDYVTSRINAKLWQANNRHGFFVMIGFDQILHYLQLFLTYKLIFA